MVNRESAAIKRTFTAFGKPVITLSEGFRRNAQFIENDSSIDSTAGAAWARTKPLSTDHRRRRDHL
jgi:hypothetical protein